LSWPKRSFLFVVLAVLLSIGIGAAIRFLLIEVNEIGQLCDPGTGPAWCMARQVIVQLFLPRYPADVGALGVAALIAGAAALIQGGRLAIYIAACLGGLGSVLYNADLAAIGLGLSLVAAARA
jgi:hypothetical protein